MSTTKPNVVRKIAESQLVTTFPDLAADTRHELATSLVRQWLTNNGAAILITRDHQFRFQLTRAEDGTSQVARTVLTHSFTEKLRRSGVLEDEISKSLHDLSICQSAECQTYEGKVLQLRVDPANGRFYIERARDADVE